MTITTDLQQTLLSILTADPQAMPAIYAGVEAVLEVELNSNQRAKVRQALQLLRDEGEVSSPMTGAWVRVISEAELVAEVVSEPVQPESVETEIPGEEIPGEGQDDVPVDSDEGVFEMGQQPVASKGAAKPAKPVLDLSVGTQVCRCPKCEFGGKPQPRSNFGTRRQGTAMQPWCKKCRSKKNYATSRKPVEQSVVTMERVETTPDQPLVVTFTPAVAKKKSAAQVVEF